MRKMIEDILNYKIIHLEHYNLTVSSLLGFVVFLVVSLMLMAAARKLVKRSKILDEAKKFSFAKLSNYVLGVFVIIIGMNLLGINVTLLTASSAALMVGVGFGLQNLFNDFISGVIILLDQTLKVGDIIEVNGMIYKVGNINFRTTTVIGRDENYVILPNSQLTGNSVINWTHSDISSRFRVDIGVDYSTDVLLLMKILKDVALKNPRVLREPAPFVRFEDYGESSLNFSLYFFTNEIFRVENVKSDLRIEIFKELQKNNKTIPFPQRVLHMQNK